MPSTKNLTTPLNTLMTVKAAAPNVKWTDEVKKVAFIKLQDGYIAWLAAGGSAADVPPEVAEKIATNLDMLSDKSVEVILSGDTAFVFEAWDSVDFDDYKTLTEVLDSVAVTSGYAPYLEQHLAIDPGQIKKLLKARLTEGYADWVGAGGDGIKVSFEVVNQVVDQIQKLSVSTVAAILDGKTTFIFDTAQASPLNFTSLLFFGSLEDQITALVTDHQQKALDVFVQGKHPNHVEEGNKALHELFGSGEYGVDPVSKDFELGTYKGIPIFHEKSDLDDYTVIDETTQCEPVALTTEELAFTPIQSGIEKKMVEELGAIFDMEMASLFEGVKVENLSPLELTPEELAFLSIQSGVDKAFFEGEKTAITLEKLKTATAFTEKMSYSIGVDSVKEEPHDLPPVIKRHTHLLAGKRQRCTNDNCPVGA